MNNIGNLDYSIDTTVKDNKLIIEYSGSVFKDNPSLVTKKSGSVMVKETENGFAVEMDIKKKGNLNFSINNVNNQDVNKKSTESLSLVLVEQNTIWTKIKTAFKKIKILGLNKETENVNNIK